MNINITTKGIDDAINKLKSLEITLPDVLRIVLERLMNEGYNVASTLFSEALYAGTNDVKVEPPVWEDDTLVLRANGKSVAFIEFGTGTIATPYPILPTGENPYANLGMSGRGEYGKGHGANPPWYYPIEKGLGNTGRPKVEKDGTESEKWAFTLGNPPARAMYQAAVTISDKQRILEIAKEVLDR